MRYLISYDLRNPGQNYEKLIEAIKVLGGRSVLKSQWCLRHNNTSAKRLRDHFWGFMDPNDRLLVVGIDNDDWSGKNLINRISNM